MWQGPAEGLPTSARSHTGANLTLQHSLDFAF